MKLVPITVQCYAGYKADESPRRFLLGDRWFEIIEVLDRWHEGGRNADWAVADYFRVVADDKREYLIKHDLEADDWSLAQRA